MSITFTKLFSSITESTVWCEPSNIRIVWITMLAMADKRGRVWASVPGLANRARVPIEDARAAITTFLSPDPDSRTPDYEGRRIEAIDGGWRLLNYDKYRATRDDEDRREQTRVAVAKHRANVSQCKPNVSHGKPGKAQAEAEAEAFKKEKKEHLSDSPKSDAITLLEYLNAKTGHNYRPAKTNIDLLMARLATSTPDDIKAVIDGKVSEWKSDPKMRAFLRPSTLFRASNFEQYLGQVGSMQTDDFYPFPADDEVGQ